MVEAWGRPWVVRGWGVHIQVVLVGWNDELAGTLEVILRVRWHELELLRASNTADAVRIVQQERPALLLFAADEPSACCDLITQVRAHALVPIVAIGQCDDYLLRIRALEMGADDWISTLSMPMEFIARINAILRRCCMCDACAGTYVNGPLSIDFATQEVRIDGHPADLTPTEFRVLCQLARHEGTVVSRERLLGEVWGDVRLADAEYLKKYIYQLRAKLGDDSSEPRLIINRRGVGYMLPAIGPTKP